VLLTQESHFENRYQRRISQKIEYGKENFLKKKDKDKTLHTNKKHLTECAFLNKFYSLEHF
jgi:hypothetical protein